MDFVTNLAVISSVLVIGGSVYAAIRVIQDRRNWRHAALVVGIVLTIVLSAWGLSQLFAPRGRTNLPAVSSPTIATPSLAGPTFTVTPSPTSTSISLSIPTATPSPIPTLNSGYVYGLALSDGLYETNPPVLGKYFQANFALTNIGSHPVFLGAVEIEIRGPNGQRMDLPYHAFNAVINPSQLVGFTVSTSSLGSNCSSVCNADVYQEILVLVYSDGSTLQCSDMPTQGTARCMHSINVNGA